MKVLGDVGATHMRFTVTGAAAAQPLFQVETPCSHEAILERIRIAVERLSNDTVGPCEGLVLGVPGLVNRSGVVTKSLYGPFADTDVRAVLEGLLQLPVCVINDAQAQAMGAAESAETLLYMVVGTAVGGAITSGGDTLRGARGFAGEIGHLPVPGESDLCPCGSHGCLDTVASGWSFDERLGKRWWCDPSLGVSRLAAHLRKAGRSAGSVLGYSSRLCDPAVVVVAGWPCRHPDFRSALTAELGRHAWADLPVRFHTSTWTLASAGLDRIADLSMLNN